MIPAQVQKAIYNRMKVFLPKIDIIALVENLLAISNKLVKISYQD